MIADTFIKRPVTAMVISIVIVLVGLIAVTTLPVAQYPDITPPTVTISGNFIGADAQTVEQTTTTAIETQVNGSPGMDFITSNSSSNGQSGINVTYRIGTNVDIAALDAQNRTSIAEPALPDAVKRLGLVVRKRNPSIMMVLAFYSPHGTHDETFIGNYINIYVRDALLRVPGVGDVTSFGDEFGMRVWLNPEKLSNLKLTTTDVINALTEQNLQVAAGTIGGNPQPNVQTFEYSVLTNSRLNKKEDFDNIIVRTNPAEGSVVYLKDIARVELAKFNYGFNAYINGKRGAFMLIFQAPGANALSTYQGVNNALNELRKSFPKDVEYLSPFETVSVVKVSIDEVVTTLGSALALVVLVVFLFLQSWRATLSPLLAIPVSLIGTFIFFVPLGFTVNTLTLFAFVLAIGIVVDDAIIVVEAAQHYIDEEHLSAKEATERAMQNISGPVVAIALILAAVFIPVGFVPGILGRLYQQFAITIGIAVLISAFVALSLTPALCTVLLKPSKEEGAKRNILEKFFAAFNRGFGKTSRAYTRSVARWIRGMPYVSVLLACLFVGLFFLFKNKQTGFIPTEDNGRLFVTYEMPEGTSTTRSVEMLKVIQSRLQQIPAVKTVGGLAGFNFVSFSNKSNVGTIFVALKPWSERKNDQDKLYGVMAQIQQFEQVARNFVGELNKRPEIAMAYTFFNARTPSYKVDVDRDKAKKLGVQVNDVYTTLSTLLGSSYVNDFNIYGRNFRVMAQADTSYRRDVSDLGLYYVRNSQGNMIPLTALVTTQVIEAPSLVSHFNLYRNIEILGQAKQGYSSGQAIDALKDVAAKSLPAGYGYDFAGLSREEVRAGSSTGTIFAISIVFVFLFLAALYESWSIPFSVLFAVPVGAFGAILTLTLLPNISNNIYAQIGLITLIGLSAKNAILIVEYAKERVDRGLDVVHATLQAVQLRLRPIIMTSLAFIFGVLPFAFSTGAGAEARKTIGWTVFGGMLAATSLAIFIVPVLFVLITKISYGKKLKRLKEEHKKEEEVDQSIFSTGR